MSRLAKSRCFRCPKPAPRRRDRTVVAAFATILLGSWLVACAASGPEPVAAPSGQTQAAPAGQPPGAVTLEDVQRELEWRKDTKKKLDQTLE
ncbi:MAG: hypothetical protein ACREDZ_09895 [Kiloniellales bacterium]